MSRCVVLLARALDLLDVGVGPVLDHAHRASKAGAQGGQAVLDSGGHGRIYGPRHELVPGYRSPGWDLSPNSVRLLLEYRFVYDSSMMGADYQPYWCRRNDVPHRDRAYGWGEEVELVEFPVSWTLDDFPQMEFLLNAALPGLSG